METITIRGNMGVSNILIGERLENLHRYVPVSRAIIITDVNVHEIYRLNTMADDVITIGTGEEIKTLETVGDIYAQLVSLKADRSSFIVGIGGGIVCDIAGFVASTFLRGVRFGFVATTLLAQVDASVGGKNGVNYGGYKNMVGVFNQPEFVICDLDLLKTLPQRERLCGFAEIVKHAAIADADLFAYLEQNYKSAHALDSQVIEKLVVDSVTIKSSIVNRDETERGERRILNFGHTFGHAIEKATGVPHGEAVSRGMAIASALSVRRAHLSAAEDQRLKALLHNLKLPTRLESEPRRILEALGKDKKREDNCINFVLLHKIGNAIVDKISFEELKDAIDG
jgi:3-dehydroquinate synthase